MKELILLIILKVISETCEYELVCPVSSEWGLRARAINCTGKYVCLQRIPEYDYIEDCNGPNLSNRGTKLVFQPNFNNAKCSKTRFQPFRFSTESTSRCIYKKSSCNEEGQFVFHKGDFRDDRGCGCNISNGYDFVIKPKNDCFCIPSKEDCSCYKRSCRDRDDQHEQCHQEVNAFTNTSCPEIEIEMSHKPDILAQITGLERMELTYTDKGASYRKNIKITVTVFTVLVITVVISVGYCFNKKTKRQSEKGDECPGKENEPCINELEKWKLKEETFVVTRACNEVLNKIFSNSCVAVTGVGGCGKSSIVWHVAFTLQKEYGYGNVIEIKNTTDLLLNYNANTATVFVLDDVCGKFTANKQQIEEWNSIKELVKTVMSDSLCRILLSCRLQVFKDSKFLELEEFKSCECNIISENLCLTTLEKKAIFKSYMKVDLTVDVILSEKNDLFPLLCELYSKEKNSKCIVKYFTTPYEIYREELENLRKQDKLKLCGIIICVIYNNKLKEKAFEKMSHDFCQIVYSICKYLDLEIALCDGSKIENAIKTLEGTFVKVQNGLYMIIHDKVFDILAFYFGKIIIKELIQYADSEFLRERFLWKNEDKIIQTEEYINFDHTLLELYIERLILDWEKTNIFDVFCNINMQDDAFRDKFIKHLKGRPEQCTRKLANICVNLKNNYAAGNTPLIITSSEGHVDLIEWLLSQDANVNHSRKDGVSALYMASQKGHLNVVKALLEKHADVNATTDEGVTPLGAACYISGNIDIVRKLLDHNADVNKYKYQDNDMTPLFMACQNNFIDIVKLLLQKKANPNICLTDGSSPLLLSCIKGHTHVVRLLLDNKADPNREISGGYTPLFAAACMGFTDIVELLLKNGADRNIFLPNTEEIRNELKLLPLTPTIGSSTLLEGKNRMWSWFDSIEQQFSDNLRKYIYSKEESYLIDVFVGSSPLHAASFLGHFEIVQILIQGLSSVDIKKESDGITPLFYACELGHHDIVTALIEKGADPRICRRDRISPMQIAIFNGHNELLPLLQKTNP